MSIRVGYTKTMTYIIDRFEDNNLAVLETDDGTKVDVPWTQVPPEAKEGDVLIELAENDFDGEVRYAVEVEASEQRRRKVSDLRASLPTVAEDDIEL